MGIFKIRVVWILLKTLLHENNVPLGFLWHLHENNVPLGFLWHFQDTSCVDFVEDTLSKSSGDIC